MKRKAAVILALAALVSVWIMVSPFLATALIVEKPLDHADAIMVLSGSAVFKERTRKAAELYKQGVAPRIFITDDATKSGWNSGEEKNVPYVELEQRELLANGVPPEAITVLPGTVAGTDDEAKKLSQELTDRPLGRVVIVTSAYHTRRALRTFEKILADTPTEIGIAHPPTGEQTPSPNYWYLRPRGWQTVALEYVKSLVYYAYY